MALQEHTSPEKLERYAFLWSEARLVIAALALFLGGVPPVIFIFGYSFGLVGTLLGLAWIISGVVSIYLLYLWHTSGHTVFGGKDMKDTFAFFINIVTGINLGIAGIGSGNIGMQIVGMSKVIFLIAGVVYLITAWHLWKRWKENGEHLFGGQLSTQPSQSSAEHAEEATNTQNTPSP